MNLNGTGVIVIGISQVINVRQKCASWIVSMVTVRTSSVFVIMAGLPPCAICWLVIHAAMVMDFATMEPVYARLVGMENIAP